MVESTCSVSPPSHRVPMGRRLARFMELRGRRVIEACGVLWHGASGEFCLSLPYQLTLEPEPSEVDDMLRRHAAAGVRFPSLTWPGLSGGVYLARHKRYDLSSIHIKHRGRVRRGLDRHRIDEVDPDELFAKGMLLNRDTMLRQGRYDPEFGEVDRWRRFTRAMRESPGVSAIGAFSDDSLAAYMVLCREDGCLHILHQMSSGAHLKDTPNHALTFWVTRQAAEDPELEACCYGLVPLQRLDGLHEYKICFGYDLIPHQSVIRLHPILAPLLGNSIMERLVHTAHALRPGDQSIERLETVIRGARKGRECRSIEQPECGMAVANRKAKSNPL